ncbi:hypothetical protein SLA2020_052940 [Shorea laevis]
MDVALSSITSPEYMPYIKNNTELDWGEVRLGVLGGTNFPLNSNDSVVQYVSQQSVSNGKHKGYTFDHLAGEGTVLYGSSLHTDYTPILLPKSEHAD